MNNGLSLSIFTIVVDRTPAVTFGCKKHSEAEAICADERIRAKLRTMISGDKSLIDDYSILHVRLARPNERTMYYEQARSRPNEGSMLMVQLVGTDGLPIAPIEPEGTIDGFG
jgi:hypothetical protein